MNKAELIKKMNVLLADLQVEYVKLHNYHWNVKGQLFFSIHNVTEEYYEYMTGQYDEVAERILQLGGKPLATMAEYLENANLKEESNNEFNAGQVIEALLSDFSSLLESFKSVSEAAGEAGDVSTANIADDNIQWFEKAIWMLKAHQS